MTEIGQIIYLLRNTPVREIITALERDGFSLGRTTQTGGHIHIHPLDKRIVVIHYHHGGDTFKRKTLKSILEGTRWSKEDLQRLTLID